MMEVGVGAGDATAEDEGCDNEEAGNTAWMAVDLVTK